MENSPSLRCITLRDKLIERLLNYGPIHVAAPIMPNRITSRRSKPIAITDAAISGRCGASTADSLAFADAARPPAIGPAPVVKICLRVKLT